MLDELIQQLAKAADESKPHENVRSLLVTSAVVLRELRDYLELTEAPTLESLDPFRELLLELGRVLRLLRDSSGVPSMLAEVPTGIRELRELHNETFDRLDVYRALMERALLADTSPVDELDALVVRRRRVIEAADRYEWRLDRLLSPSE